MGLKIIVRDTASKKELTMELNPNDTIATIIENAVSYWEKKEGNYKVKLGSKILEFKFRLKDIGLKSGAVLELSSE
jgi:hypothetical protein